MRVVQDSDDEFEDEDFEAEISQPADTNASQTELKTTANVSPQACEPGTGSTESLRTTIEAAHHAHLQPQPVASIPTLPLQNYALGSPGSQLEHRSKRRKTSVDACPSIPFMVESMNNQAPITCGQSQSIFSSPFLEQSEERLLSQEGKKDIQHASESTWDLQGIMRYDCAQHEPTALFPEPSSTVPNATATQQRLLEEVMAPGFLGLNAMEDGVPYEPAKSSVPWSDFLKTSIASGGPYIIQSEIHTDFGQDLNDLLDPTPKSHRIRQSSQRPIEIVDDAPTMSQSLLRSQQPNELELSQRSRQTSPAIKGPLLSNHILHGDNELEEVQEDTHEREARQLDSFGSSSGPNQKPKSNSTINSDDELAAIGIPKEQYKPRPSRSRSLKLDIEEPIDYSRRCERVTRRGVRRRKTTNGVHESSVAITPRRMRQICDMGFAPSTTESALKHNNGDVNQTVEWLIANSLSEDELAPKSSRSRGRAKKGCAKIETPDLTSDSTKEYTPESEEQGRRESLGLTPAPEFTNLINTNKDALGEAIEEDKEHILVTHPTAPRVQVVVPKLKTKGCATPSETKEESPKAGHSEQPNLVETSIRNAKRRETSSIQPEPALDECETALVLPSEKKRGRGRPRKETKVPISTNTIQEQHDDGEQGEQDTCVTVLGEMQINVTPAGVHNEKELHESFGTTPPAITEPTISTSPSKTMPTPANSYTPESQTKQANNVLSPLNKGKVPYRVGLSKRARIAPLLRMMKK